ncbi:MAG: hypothetical protein LUH82_00400, partial [Clostridiales bacterium]|nr:hypothetical protein [Clostridiales bacterium]
MKKQIKRLLAVFLAMTVISSSFIFTSYAAESEAESNSEAETAQTLSEEEDSEEESNDSTANTGTSKLSNDEESKTSELDEILENISTAVGMDTSGIDWELAEEDARLVEDDFMQAALLAEKNSLQYQINELAGLYSTVENSGGAMTAAVTLATTLAAGLIDDTLAQQTVTLDQNYAESLVIPDGTEVTLDLNGYTLLSAATGNHITVYGTLIITDSSAGETGQIMNYVEDGVAKYSNTRGVTVASGGSLTLQAGTVSGYTASSVGGGIEVQENGSFTMTGGTVCNNSSGSYGGGIFIFDSASGEITSGSITGNSAQQGGGVAIYSVTSSEYSLENVTIDSNSATSNGGGLYIDSKIDLTLSGVSISGNTSGGSGGGVYLGAGTSQLTVESATAIDNNTADSMGGGVFITNVSATAASSFTLSGGSVSGNT